MKNHLLPLLLVLAACVPPVNQPITPPANFPLKPGSTWLISYHNLAAGPRVLQVGEDFKLQDQQYRVGVTAKNQQHADTSIRSGTANFSQAPKSFLGFTYTLSIHLELASNTARGDMLLCYLSPLATGGWEGKAALARYDQNRYVIQRGSEGSCRLQAQ